MMLRRRMMETMQPAEPMAKTRERVIFFRVVRARSQTMGMGRARIKRSLTELQTAFAMSVTGC